MALAILALAYVGWVLSQHRGDLEGSLASVGSGGMLAFLVLATASIMLTTTYHGVLLGEIVADGVPLTRTFAAYAGGQIVRYLPGKVWGLLYEANALRDRADLGSITLSVLVQTFLGYGWATVLAGTILLAAYSGNPGFYLLLVPAACVVVLAHRIPWPRRFMAALPLLGRLFKIEHHPIRLGTSVSLRLSGLLILNWLPFIAGWIFLIADTHGPAEAVTYGAAYILASIATTALVVIPSGLVVREALFTWLGAAIGLPVADLLLYGVLVRLILTLGDILNAGFFIVLDLRNRRGTADKG